MMRNKSDEAEMTFFFLSLLLVKEGMNFYFYFIFYSVIENFWEIDFFFFGLVAELGFVGGKWGLWNCELNK